jgi:hypothetical protein
VSGIIGVIPDFVPNATIRRRTRGTIRSGDRADPGGGDTGHFQWGPAAYPGPSGSALLPGRGHCCGPVLTDPTAKGFCEKVSGLSIQRCGASLMLRACGGHILRAYIAPDTVNSPAA